MWVSSSVLRYLMPLPDAWSPLEHAMMGWRLHQYRSEGSEPAIANQSLPGQLYSLKTAATGEKFWCTKSLVEGEENGEQPNWHKLKAALILGLWPSISLSTDMPPALVLKLTLQQSTSISKIQQGIRMSLLGFAAEENEQFYKKQPLMLQTQFQSHLKKAPTHFSLLKGPFGWWQRDSCSFSVFTPLQ